MTGDVIQGSARLCLRRHGKKLRAQQLLDKGIAFAGAAVLLAEHGGNAYVVRHLLCQGLEITAKAGLLLCDFDRYKPLLRRFGHDLEAVVAEVRQAYGLLPLPPDDASELASLGDLYRRTCLRYDSNLDILIDGGTIPCERVLVLTQELLRVASHSAQGEVRA